MSRVYFRTKRKMHPEFLDAKVLAFYHPFLLLCAFFIRVKINENGILANRENRENCENKNGSN